MPAAQRRGQQRDPRGAGVAGNHQPRPGRGGVDEGLAAGGGADVEHALTGRDRRQQAGQLRAFVLDQAHAGGQRRAGRRGAALDPQAPGRARDWAPPRCPRRRVLRQPRPATAPPADSPAARPRAWRCRRPASARRPRGARARAIAPRARADARGRRRGGRPTRRAPSPTEPVGRAGSPRPSPAATRRSTALTRPAALDFLAVRTSATESLTAAAAGTRSRKSSWYVPSLSASSTSRSSLSSGTRDSCAMAASSRDCQRIVPTTSSWSRATSRGSTSVPPRAVQDVGQIATPARQLDERVEGGAAGRRDHGVSHRSPGRRPRPAWNAAAGSGRPPSCCRTSRRSACPSPAGDVDPVAAGGDDGAWRCRRRDRRHGAAMHDDAAAVADQRRVRPRMEPAHLVVQRPRRTPPVDRRIGAGDLGRVAWRGSASCGSSATGPRRRRSSTRTSSAAPSDGERPLQLVAGHVGGNRHRHAIEHRPGVEFLDHAHDRHPGHRGAIENRPVHRCGAAIRRQQRRVHVDQAEARLREQPGGQDLAVGGDHAEVGAERRERLGDARLGQPGRLQQRQPARLGELLHRAGGDVLAAAAGPIGLRDHADDVQA